jgi:hypothetical protein
MNTMKTATLAASFILAAATAGAGTPLRGEYVEARTAEIFTGGCIMSSQAETLGRQAVLAWHVTSGTYDGQRLDGLSVVAALSGDRNLGIREIGGEAPSYVRAVVYVDQRATPAARHALVRMVNELSRGLITEVVEVKPVAVSFASTDHAIAVSAGDAELAVTKHMHHDPSCGAMKWFTPFSQVEGATMGVTDAQSYAGRELDTRWSDPHKRSAFYGTFDYTPQRLGTN